MTWLRHRWLTAVFLVIVATMLWTSFSLGRTSAWIPQIVLAVTGLLLLAQLIVDFKNSEAREKDDKRQRRERAAMAWIAALLICVWLFGLVVGSAVFCLAWLRWHAGERWITCLAFSAVAAGMIWGVFFGLLNSTLYSGVLSAAWL